MSERLVSVLIPRYNAERWLTETLESVLAQTWVKKEIIVVNDGSTDYSGEILRRYRPRGVKVIEQENCGAGAARNRALNEAPVTS
jgi:teichuronic acid biosynthesis glycosyltransferase TuaG